MYHFFDCTIFVSIPSVDSHNTLVTVTEGFPCGRREYFCSDRTCSYIVPHRKAGWKNEGMVPLWCTAKQEVCLTASVCGVGWGGGGGASSLWRELGCVSLKSHVAEASRTEIQQTHAGRWHFGRVCASMYCHCACMGAKKGFHFS